jgi:anaerobic ribonucleoside-triphosphate reductase activating protein
MQTDYELVTFLNNIDVLVDGKFVINKAVKNLKTLEEQEKYKLRGSTNQRIIDVKQSLKQNKVILYKFN